MRFRLSLAVVLAFLVLVRAAAAQPAPPADIAELLAPILEMHHLPGLVGAVVDGDQVTALGAVGVRKAGSLEPMTANDLIHLGSDTKAMTALLIGQLVNAGKLKFETTMREAFPDLAAKMNAEMAEVTVKQIMTHTAGLPANLPWAAYGLGGKPLTEQRRMVAEQVLSAAPATKAGAMVYSNLGYVLLGAIIEAKCGKPWEEVASDKLFQPLHMTSAGFGPPGKPGEIKQPWGHALVDGKLQPSQGDNPPVLTPAGRVHCTITDWAKFISLFLDAGQGKPRLLKASTYEVLMTPTPPGEYAGGWLVTQRPWGGGAVLTHSGSNTQWHCVAWVAPKKNFAVLLATNVGGPDAAKACDEAAAALIGWHTAHTAK